MRRRVILPLVMLAGVANAQSPREYIITDLRYAGAPRVQEARRINEAGIVVGLVDPPLGAFAYQDGELSILPPLTEGGSIICPSVNDAGQICGVNWRAQDRFASAVRWDDGQPIPLAALTAGGPSAAFGLNNAGVAVGVAVNELGQGRPVIWPEPEVVIDLAILPEGEDCVALAINDAGTIVCGGEDADGNEIAVVLDASGAVSEFAANTPRPEVVDINAHGQISGLAPRDDWGAFLLEDGKYVRLPYLPGGDMTHAYGLNDAGDAVGMASDGDDNTIAVLWSGGSVQRLDALIPNEAGWTRLFVAGDITNDGRIAGLGFRDGTWRSFLLTPVWTCRGDVDGDGAVGLSDLAQLLTVFGSSSLTPGFVPLADVDSSNTVDVQDLALLLARFSQACD